ncbi:SDR family oxidoreductase [Catalinimonas niigatensis]|uniref:SDR family oxidoreductase n=1 Tax=Catalinimonas niigatensis TaxID=1397264 RepID=UPI00266641EB|nr:SDR family oxidoreductase [Catalinimonas niigatensis]WPP49590.1 SDR family oxidoreductase [Catalinimonas niigatensis]
MTNYPKQVPQQEQKPPGKESKMHPQPIIIRESYRGSEKLKGKKALITGGDSGIGRAVALHFAREGADVAIIYLKEDEDAKKTKSLVEKENKKCIILQGDIREREFCNRSVKETINELGGIDILVNNAAEQHPHDDLNEMDLDLMEDTFRTNIFAMIQMCKAALPHMKEDSTIINTSSVTAYRGSSHLLDYASTKGAIISFTRSLSQNLVSKKIRVNAVAPGPIWTPLIPSTFDDVEEFGKQVPMERPGQPSEVAPAYVFLASEDASYITGQVIHINGGEMIGG